MLLSNSQPEKDLDPTQPLRLQLEKSLSHTPAITSEENLPQSADFIQFWRSFRLFPWKIDEYTFAHWYLFTFGLEGVLLVLGIVTDILAGFSSPAHNGLYYFLQDFSESVTHAELTDWIYLAGVFSISFIAIAFNLWRKNIPTLFQELFHQKRISSLQENSDVQQEYLEFLHTYQKSLLSRKRLLLLGAVCILSLLLTWGSILSAYRGFLYYGSLLPQNPLLGLRGILLFLLYRVIGTIFAVFLEGYVFIIGGLALAITGKYLQTLAQQFKFHIQPGHPDNCGGFKSLGAFSFGIASPILILSLLLGFYAFLGFTSVGKHLLEPILSAILLPFLLVLSIIAFFTPLWGFHRQMVERKKEYEDHYAQWNAQLESMIQSSFDHQAPFDNQALEQAKIAKEGREILQTLHPDKINYPVWPFDLRIFIAFIVPQIPALLSVLSGLKTPIIEMVKNFFHF